jgi:transcriptional regulator with XRE-family HTH domain
MIPGEAIALLRRQQGLTQEALAERADTTQRHISQIENGQQQPKLSMLQGIADAFGIPLWVLFYGQPDHAQRILLLLADCTEQEQTRLLQALEVLKPVLHYDL